MKTALALRHIHFEDLGTLEPVLLERGYAVTYLDPGLDDLDDPEVRQADLLIVLGGPIGASDDARYPFLERELNVVRQRLASGRPLLGICLGAQLIARAGGATVSPLGVKEIGFTPLTLTPEGEDSVLAPLGEMPVLHWHGDQFEIPEGAARLASTVIGHNQAFSIGRNVLGLQFHLEADVNGIECWLVGHACELEGVGIDPRTLRNEAKQLDERLKTSSRTVFSAWLDGLVEEDISFAADTGEAVAHAPAR
ncbi:MULTISPECIES: glutamine amidotransferase [unclassified Modicisalibacter]|uniref:glutamine amidotransferase n=1 Tax=unclassified Modicisalibacter TaxID=2679913 RepID=UPI001CCA4FBA|nr:MULTISPECIES: glutamine amidotransferase [unclassified Modicisalibacter]MBZ9556513.1 glutamine amidotransferase [Modicisalibacter sp. R2A 31.J]MBZ9575018.1 glutamine amidotransferase [Modicisalibacter sp. MOD 31.J]